MDTATKNTVRKVIPVTGMSCASCAISVESVTAELEGVKNAAVNFAAQTLQVEYDPEAVGLKDFRKAIQSIGYDLIIDENAGEKQEIHQHAEHRNLQRSTIAAAILTLPVVVIGMFFMDISYAKYIMWALSTPVLFVFGRRFFINAVKQAAHRKANMDTLVALRYE